LYVYSLAVPFHRLRRFIVEGNGSIFQSFGGDEDDLNAFFLKFGNETPPTEILLALVEPFLTLDKKLSRDELLDELLHSMACKAAVKAGDRLSAQSV
jgi:DNA mismatch repair protein MutL